MTASILDSWALIGWLQGEEPARAKVRELLEQASRGAAKVSISLINVGDPRFPWGCVSLGDPVAFDAVIPGNAGIHLSYNAST